jgi:hypothetical protein
MSAAKVSLGLLGCQRQPNERPAAPGYDGVVLRFVLKRSRLKRLAHGFPVLGLLLTVEVALMARGHFVKLNGVQRRRLLALVRQAKGRPSSLSEAERQELGALLATLEPRLFIGSAVRRLSPVPMPKRLLYGPRGTSARTAAARRR